MALLHFILVALQIKGTFDKIEIDVIGLYLGIVLLIIGTGAIFLQNGTTPSLLVNSKMFENLGRYSIIIHTHRSISDNKMLIR